MAPNINVEKKLYLPLPTDISNGANGTVVNSSPSHPIPIKKECLFQARCGYRPKPLLLYSSVRGAVYL
jgi:hypothetical protein